MSTRQQSSARTVYEAIAEAVATESEGPMFALMGSANMYFLGQVQRAGTRIVGVHHENMAISMADGHFRATGAVGLCAVTVGPGLTQIATSLMVASRRRSSMVVFAGDSLAGPGEMDLHVMDQRAFVEAAGGIFVPVRSSATVAEDVQSAFLIARTAPGPVVLDVATEIQESLLPSRFEYAPARDLVIVPPPIVPDSAALAEATRMIDAAQRPVMIAGRGAMTPEALSAIERLAESSGALLATTLPAKGAFDGNAFDVEIAGGYASFAGARLIMDSDCVVAFGASFSYHTTQADRMFPHARVISVNTSSNVLVNSRRRPDLTIVGDAALTAAALAESVASGVRYRSAEVTHRLAGDLRREEIEARPVEVADGTVDPRELSLVLDDVLPDDCTVVISPSHSGYFPARFLRGKARQFITTTEFGCIGHGMSTAIGIAVARADRPVVVFEGDGATIMNIQELHTAVVNHAHLLVVVLDDQAFGSELHRLSAHPEAAALSIMPPIDFAGIARAMGATASIVDDLADAGPAVQAFVQEQGVHLIQAHVSRKVTRPDPLAV